MEDVSQVLAGLLFKLGDFFSNNLRTIIALVLFFLSYRLFRLVILGMNPGSETAKFRRFLILLSPGAILSLAGIIVLTKLDDISSIIFYLTLTLFIGFGFAYFGYKLFDKGVLGASDVEAVWENKSILIKRAAPGTLFALFGVAIIAVSLWQGFSVVGEIAALGLEAKKRMLEVVDVNMKEALKLLAEYLQNLESAGR